MKIIKLLFFLTIFACTAHASEIITFRLFDGETVDGKLSLPANAAKINELVIYIHGTGPATYDNHRKFGTLEFNYFDYYADEFNRRGIGFFTYNKRGVTAGDEAPFFDKVDREKFRKVIPTTEVQDIATFIRTLRSDNRLKKTKIVLLGWSEGTVIAAMAAEDKRNKVSALILNGYVHDNMWDLIRWQNSGASAMISFRDVFDKDKNSRISRAEYESVDKTVAEFRVGRLQNTKFEQLDVNKDGMITTADFGNLQTPRFQAIRDAIGRDDEEWIWKNYFRISIPWLVDHFVIEPNKTRLLRLDMPIYIFHGQSDANCPVEGVYDLRRSFNRAGKTNLFENVIPGHNHDLNFVDWVSTKVMPEGIRKMFEATDALNK